MEDFWRPSRGIKYNTDCPSTIQSWSFLTRTYPIQITGRSTKACKAHFCGNVRWLGPAKPPSTEVSKTQKCEETPRKRNSSPLSQIAALIVSCFLEKPREPNFCCVNLLWPFGKLHQPTSAARTTRRVRPCWPESSG